ncbi:MAG TPA: hypothetical protein VNZ55_05410 [Thermomicrobiales bacterium]|nr:hypothetical protein [Thermomicrobiales bacterium]
MLQIQEGQCGLCVHFGENTSDEPKLIQIRLKHEAPDTLVEPCGLPENAALDLKVTPISGCSGFEPADGAAQA